MPKLIRLNLRTFKRGTIGIVVENLGIFTLLLNNELQFSNEIFSEI